MIDRRFFLRLTGLAVAASALEALPVSAQSDAPVAPGGAAVLDPARSVLQPPGMYQISGRVRLEEPLVEISGITNAQQISWSTGSLRSPVASFSSFEQFTQPWQMPEIRVRGGQLEALTVAPVQFV